LRELLNFFNAYVPLNELVQEILSSSRKG